MGNDAGNKGAAFVEYDNEQIAYGRGVADLNQGGDKLGTVQQIDDVARTEGHWADDNSTFDAWLCHHFKEKAPENDLFNESDVEHCQDVEQYFPWGMVEIEAAPQIDRHNNGERDEV